MADYYKFKNNEVKRGQYQSSLFGKIAIGITAPAVVLTFISLILAFARIKIFGASAFAIVLICSAITIAGCIMIAIDIVIFNRRQKKENPTAKGEPKAMDIGRMVHLLIGIVVGIIIGYLIWGAKFGPR